WVDADMERQVPGPRGDRHDHGQAEGRLVEGINGNDQDGSRAGLLVAAFRSGPSDLVGVCRPHPWDQLTAAPADGLRSVRDILVHLMDNEAGWLGLIRGEGRRRFDPAAFGSLDDVLAAWVPLRDSSAALILGLTADERQSRRPLPWDASASVSVEEIVWHVV